MDNKNKNIPLVSVALMTYNTQENERVRYLRGVIDSWLLQTYPNLELIISNDASPDASTDEICEEYARKDKRIRYIKQKENLGLVPCYKFILNRARGKYFIWASDDDLWDKRFLEDCVSLYRTRPGLVMVFGGMVDIGKDGKVSGHPDPAKYVPLEKDLYKRLKAYLLFSFSDGKNQLLAGLWKRETILDDPLFGLRVKDDQSPGIKFYWGFDNFFTFRNLAKGPVGFVPQTRFFHRSHVLDDLRKPRPFPWRMVVTLYHRLEKVFASPFFWYEIWLIARLKELPWWKKLKLIGWNFFVMVRLFFVRKT